ncbi:MAG: dsDNA nuclease domain-containing protein [Eubacteriales bacterium]
METGVNFTVVFDYACDVEIHMENKTEFYQLKTHKTKKNYTIRSLTKIEKENSQGSILGKLYVLNTGKNKNVKLAIVTNVLFSGFTECKVGENVFTALTAEKLQKIEDSLKSELGIDSVDLSNTYYVFTRMNLEEPENEMMGKIIKSFVEIMKCEPDKPNALYRLINDEVQEKACYELLVSSYEELVSKKGITRIQFERMMQCHAINEKTGIKQTEEYINSLSDILQKKKYKKALSNILGTMANSKPLLNLENEISEYLMTLEEIESIDSLLDDLSNRFHGQFPIEITNAEKTVYYLIIAFKFEEGVYDDEGDV